MFMVAAGTDSAGLFTPRGICIGTRLMRRAAKRRSMVTLHFLGGWGRTRIRLMRQHSVYGNREGRQSGFWAMTEEARRGAQSGLLASSGRLSIVIRTYAVVRLDCSSDFGDAASGGIFLELERVVAGDDALGIAAGELDHALLILD